MERKCSSLRNEKAAFKTDSSKERFKHCWLSRSYGWVRLVEEGVHAPSIVSECLQRVSLIHKDHEEIVEKERSFLDQALSAETGRFAYKLTRLQVNSLS